MFSTALLLVLSISSPAAAQLVADGTTLEVTTSRMRAMFRGGDLVRAENLLTGETVCASPDGGVQPVARLARPNGAVVENANGYGWVIGDYEGLPYAWLAKPDGSAPNSIRMEVWVDPSTDQVAVRIAGEAPNPGLKSVRWGLLGFDLTSHRLLLPVTGGVVFDAVRPPPPGFTAQSDTRWESPFLMLASRQGGMVVFNAKHEAPFRSVEVVSSAENRISLAVATLATGPWASATAIPSVEWRLDCYRGTWMDGADIYRQATQADWAEPRLPAGAEWIRDIRTVITFSGDPLDPGKLAALTDPKQTLLYVPSWRAAGYDRNYPDYTPSTVMSAFVERARQLGFRVMLHANPYGVSTYNPEYARMQRFQVRDPESGRPQGWLWDERPATDPIRFAYINPASSEWRNLLLRNLRLAITRLRPDALHIDQTGLAINDGNGLIESRTAVQGMIELHRELAAEFPNVLLSGESVYDQLAPHQWLAQRWLAVDFGVPGTPHPLGSYLLGARFKLYGHLGMPTPATLDYITHINQQERQAVLPTINLGTQSQIDNVLPDLQRAFRIAQAFQQNGLAVAWTPESSEQKILYRGRSNVSGVFSAQGQLRTLEVAGSNVYQRVSGVSTLRSPLLISNWPAFDSQEYFGLDPAKQYWLDPGIRPTSGPRFSRLPEGVTLTNETFHTQDASLLAVRAAQLTVLDAIDSIGAATIGTTGQTDGPLFGPATVNLSPIRAGDELRNAVFVHPPGGAASTYVDFPVTLPASGDLALIFAIGVADASPRTEPVRFAVAVDKTEVWQAEAVSGGGWTPVAVDLSRFAGRAIRLRLLTRAERPNLAWAAFAAPLVTQTSPAAPMRVSISAPGKSEVATSPPLLVSGANGQFEVIGVAPQGRAVFFYRPLRVLSIAQSLLEVPFTNLQSSDGELARPGPVFGSGNIQSATSGGIVKARAIFAHPPDRGATQLIWAGQLPDNNLQLLISAGMQDGNQSTGVIFRVLVNGQMLWEHRPAGAGWASRQVDLTRYRNQPVLIQLVTDSAGSNSFDWAYWSDLFFSVR